ncbi:MAG TPA: hypothetical protein VF212_17375 [Longimicrobiales bacterium]
MTQKPTEHRSSSGLPTWLWMVATVVVVGAFMYWLAATSEPSAPQVVEESDEPAAGAVAAVRLDDLAAGLTNYLGTEVRLEAISVASRLGEQAFWTATSNGIPFLVRLTPSLVADSVSVASGETVTVVGRVVAMSDSVLAAWEQEGVIANDNQRLEAEFATGFVEATQVVKQAAPADTTQASGAEE